MVAQAHLGGAGARLISCGAVHPYSRACQPGSYLQMEPGSTFVLLFGLVFVIIVVIGLVSAAGAVGRRGVQRPTSVVTAFPPPPLPDTVTVKCQYCGTEQVWKETCIKCGAPLPAPRP